MRPDCASRSAAPGNRPGASSRRPLGLAEQCLQEVRTLSYLLHPPLLDEMGLASALRWFARGFSERSGIDVDVRVVEDSGATLPREIATALFRVAQEALSNVHRHSGSPSARITLQRTETAIRLDVLDRGRGLRGRSNRARARKRSASASPACGSVSSSLAGAWTSGRARRAPA